MKRRLVLGTAFALALTQNSSRAYAADKVLRLGWVTAQEPASLAPMVAALRASLARLGHVEGPNLAIAFRYGDGSVDRVPEQVAELQGLGIDMSALAGFSAEEMPFVFTVLFEELGWGDAGLAISAGVFRKNCRLS